MMVTNQHRSGGLSPCGIHSDFKRRGLQNYAPREECSALRCLVPYSSVVAALETEPEADTGATPIGIAVATIIAVGPIAVASVAVSPIAVAVAR